MKYILPRKLLNFTTVVTAAYCQPSSGRESKGLYQRIPHLHQPRYRLWEVAEHCLEDTVRRKRLHRFYPRGNAVIIIRRQIFIDQPHI